MKQDNSSAPLALKTIRKARPLNGKVCMHVLGTARTDVRVMREATTLAQAGMEVSIVDIESDPTRPREEEIDGVHVKHIVMPSWFVPAHFKPWFLVKLLLMLIYGTRALMNVAADIYHAHDDTALPACYFAARLRRKRLVFDAHELPLVEPNITRWGLLHALSTVLLKSMMSRCSGIITVSPPIIRELQRLYGGRKARLIRNIPAYQAPIASDRLQQYLELDADTRIALYQGNLDSRGLHRLILAARFIDPGIVIVLMGQGANRPDLEVLIAREGVSERVKIIPAVPYAELLTWTASADIGLVVYSPSAAPTMTPNIQMCLPNKLFEYLMAGLPVLASRLDAVADIITTYDVGCIVSSLEPEEIGRAMNRMLGNRDVLARMRNNANAATQRDLCWEKEGSRFIDFYRDVIGA
ncbi:MAG TPA: glycosyltransferase [Ktedonobacteraceae bacterium]|nr:glycosyltransferase [Ktedonobacteraceae bacterium]